MATVRKWSGVAVAMESALGANKTITAIAVGATATVTATHDFAAGDYVKFSVQGMYQINNAVYRVLSVSTTVSFVIEGTGAASLDTSSFDAFTSGTCNKITFGTSITTFTNVSPSGGDFGFIDTTTIHAKSKSQMPDTSNAMTYSFDNIWDPADAGHIAMKAASAAQSQKSFKFTFGTGGPIMVFNGYVGYSGAAGGTDKITSPAVITADALPVDYAS